MKLKNAIAALLVLFAVASLGYRTVIRGGGADADPPEIAMVQAPLPTDGVVFYFFDSDVHCSTCDTLAAYAREAVETDFAEELDSGKLVRRTLDMDDPANAHFVEAFGLYAKSWVLVELRDGERVRWKNLEKMWDLAGDQAACIDYIQSHTRDFLGDAP